LSKVITFSRQFPVTHPKAGKETNFVEQILNSINIDYRDAEYVKQLEELNPQLNRHLVFDFWTTLNTKIENKKGHTIRAGQRFEALEIFTPRVWSAKPYGSKQIIIAPEMQIAKTFTFEMDYDKILVQKKWLDFFEINAVSKNDGLEYQDFLDWFKFPGNFTGQAIVWDKTIEY